jgi:predicted acylesterase/phospholipase RssA/ABC-type phosphate/phosphonate transport system substrate-binding protein
MHRRSRLLPLALLAIALLTCADLFKTDARRAPATTTPRPALTQTTLHAQTTGGAQPAPNAQTNATSTPRADNTATNAPRPTPTPPPAEPLVIRVGVVNYNGSEKTFSEYQQLFARMAEGQDNPKVSFRLVDGAYDDVLEWYKSGLLNVAILSPGVVAELLTAPEWKNEMAKLYIASEAASPAQVYNHFAGVDRRKPGAQYDYRSICLVRKNAPVQTWEDVRALAREDRVKFVFVHPLSVSGRILPEYILRDKYQLDAHNARIEWSYDHGQSLRELAAPEEGDTVRVAFVKDDAEVPLKNESAEDAARYSLDNFRKITIPELDSDDYLIPQDVVLIHPNFAEHKSLVTRLFTNYAKSLTAADTAPRKTYESRGDWLEQYGRVVGWLDGLHLPTSERAQQFLTLEQIVGKLRNLKRNRPETRVALVLSGGGAKCAYQLGAIRAIEDELDTYTDAQGKRDVDIDLVVGTSGGAINAFCVALGLTRNSQGMDELENTWENFNQTTFFEPWRPFTITIGLFIGLLQAILIILFVRLYEPEKINWHRHVGKIAVSMIAITAVLSFTSLRAWAIIPALVLFLIVCARLFGDPAQRWWKHAGAAMCVLAVVEAPAAFFDWTPWDHTAIFVAFFVALLQLVAVIVAVRIHDAEAAGWWRRSLIVFAVLVALEIVLLYWVDYWSWFGRLGKDHLMHHLWLLLTLGSAWTVLSLGALGGALLWIGIKQYKGWRPIDYNIIPSGKDLFLFRRILLTRLAILLAAIVALQLSLTLFHNDSLSDSAGVQQAMADRIPVLIKTLHPNFTVHGADDEERLRDLSRQVVAGDHTGDWLTRDLVITSMTVPGEVSAIHDSNCDPPAKSNPASDWYFYFDHVDAHQLADQAAVASADSHETAQPRAESGEEFIKKDSRFRSLRCGEYRDKLMDVVIGSSSIFPVFKPRELSASTVNGHAATLAELIDGGFAHNSPIEAAVLWGATHIILVEASPEERQEAPSGYLLANSISAFNYLFNQAQLTDARSRGHVEIFSLRPQLLHRKPESLTGEAQLALASENPCAASYTFGADGSAPAGANMCTFDFVKVFVRGAIDLGGRDALGPCFRRERAQPSF